MLNIHIYSRISIIVTMPVPEWLLLKENAVILKRS